MRRCVACCLVGLMLPLAGHAQEPPIRWKPIGPGGGGWLTALAVDRDDPQLVYLGCDVGGFYKSTNGGRSWTIMNRGLTEYYVEDILPDPQDKNTIYLGLQGGLFKSTDGGRTWQWKRSGFPEPRTYRYSAPISSLVMHPTDRRVLYAGIGRPRMNSEGKGHIYNSTDAGETWHLLDGIARHAPDAVIHRLAIRPDDPNVLFAATDKGLFRSSDGGTTFERKERGLPHRFCRNVVVSPSRPDAVYVVMWSTHAKEPWHGGVYRSDDGGQTWTARNTGLPQKVAPETREPQCTCNYIRLLVDPRDPDRVFVGSNSWWGSGLYRSTDGGQHWDKITHPSGEEKNMEPGWIKGNGTTVKCIACAPSHPDTIYYGTSMQLMTTTDGGDHWQQRYTVARPDGTWQTNGLATTCIADQVAVEPGDSQRIYAGYADVGLLVSDNEGKSWVTSASGLKRQGDLAEVVVDPDDPNVLWCKDGKWRDACHVAQSRDRGKTWQTLSGPQSGLPASVLNHLLLDPSSPAAARTLYIVSVPHGVFKSTDGGRSWKRASDGLPPAPLRVSALAMDPGHTDTLYAAVYGNTSAPQGGLFRSRDAGATWQAFGAGTVFSGVQHICVSPHDSQVLFVAARSSGKPPRQQGGIHRSTDGGKTWQLVKEDRFASCVLVSLHNPNRIYASFTRHPYHDNCTGIGVWISDDLGQSWRDASDGLTVLSIPGLTLDPNNANRIYAGSGGNGLFAGEVTIP